MRRLTARRLRARWTCCGWVFRRRTGFTLVELLVVITIIGMLMAMLVPATGQVRDIARSQVCKGKLGQLASAVKQYEALHQTLPCGVSTCMPNKMQYLVGASGAQYKNSCQGPNWILNILNNIGEAGLAEGVTNCMGSSKCGNVTESVATAEFASVGTKTPTALKCDAAPATQEKLEGDSSTLGLEKLDKGTYAANFGAGTYGDAIMDGGTDEKAEDRLRKDKLQGPFGVVKTKSTKSGFNIDKVYPNANDPIIQGGFKAGHKRGTSTAMIRDGVSNTIMLSEVIGYDSGKDGRGAWSSALMGGSMFTGKTPPNAKPGVKSEFRDHIQACDSTIKDNDPYGLKCEKVDVSSNKAAVYAAARSGHFGHLNAAMCDQSVRTFSDQTEQEIWQAFCTIRGSDRIE